PNVVKYRLPADSEEHRESVNELLNIGSNLVITSPATVLRRSIEGVPIDPWSKHYRDVGRTSLSLYSAILQNGKFRTKLFAPNATLTNEGENLYDGENHLPEFWRLAEVAPLESPRKTHLQFITGLSEIVTAAPQLDALYFDSLFDGKHLTNYAINQALWDDMVALSPKSGWSVSHRYSHNTNQHSQSLEPDDIDNSRLDTSYAADVTSLITVLQTPNGRQYGIDVSANIPTLSGPNRFGYDDYDALAASSPPMALVRKTLSLTAETNRHNALKESSITASLELSSSDVTNAKLKQLARGEALQRSDGILSAAIYDTAIQRIANDRLR
ncbi:MAG: hypothetical protein ABIR91_05210, partial [Candidatus Saccharimonadales bacterium]